MIRKANIKLTYANVVATLALFCALGGGAYAAIRVPPNSVGARQLKGGAVTKGKIAKEAINASKIAEGSITGTQIDLAALGPVPRAVNAANASDAGAVGGHAASCPANTTLIRGLCFDSEANPEAPNLEAAAEDCAAKGGFLPTPMELYSAGGTLHLGTGVGSSQHQFTDTLYSVPPTNNSYTTIVVNGNGLPQEQPAGDPSAYYCVYTLLR
jgi:hypothetical protein